VIRLAPPLTITEDELDHGAEWVVETLATFMP